MKLDKLVMTFAEYVKLDHFEKEELLQMINGPKYKMIIDDIWSRCFRPNNKHGYDDKLLDAELSHDVICGIADIYNDVLEDGKFYRD